MKNPLSRTYNVRLACLAVLVAFGVGLWAHMPYLSGEYRRLETWKIVGLYFGDFAALIWFLRFAFVHAVMGRPLQPTVSVFATKASKSIAITVVSAMFIDLCFSLFLMGDGRFGYEHGAIAQGRILDMHTHKRQLETWYDLDCVFHDSAGAEHFAQLRIEANHHQLSENLPQETILAILSENPIKKAVLIRYDPRRPERAWAEGAGWQDGNEIYWVSIACLIIQAWAVTILLLMLNRIIRKQPLPWWSDTYKALPLVIETFLMLTAGLIDRFMDSLQ